MANETVVNGMRAERLLAMRELLATGHRNASASSIFPRHPRRWEFIAQSETETIRRTAHVDRSSQH